jgi:glycosyltransferase involved in cell wall biosynthesis
LIYVDYSGVQDRLVTGVERIALELFGAEALAPLQTTHVRGNGRAAILATQQLGLPSRALLSRKALFVCPCFPPSIPLSIAAGARLVSYIHDTFLIDRVEELNPRARLYLAPAFRYHVANGRRFFVNSAATETALRRHCRADAEIVAYRPAVRNVFGLDVAARQTRSDGTDPIRIISVGTVEPRKNYAAAVRIRAALETRLGRPVELHIVGRRGWGDDWDELGRAPHVVLHGYCDEPTVRRLIDEADLALFTSNAEGLGLPLLELQYAGLPVVASDIPVFREVLGPGGWLIDPGDPSDAAARIAALLAEPGWRRRHAAEAAESLNRWNANAVADKARVLDLLEGMRTDAR